MRTPWTAYTGYALAAALGCLLTAAAPASFTEQPVAVKAAGGVVLSGTLVLPPGPGPFPVALIVAGSGPTDRDGNSRAGLKTDAYKLLAQGLAARGIASLRYDKRGVGASTTTQTEGDMRFGDLVADVLVLAQYLEAQKQVDGVAIVGHSEGSLLGILAAQRDPHVGAFVSLEGAGRSIPAILEEQLRAGGAPPAILDEAIAYDKQLLAGKIVPSPDPQLSMLYRPSVQPYLISWFRYDPAAEIAKLKIPVLVVQGTTDIQVSVADAKRLAAANPHAQLALVKGMNHVLRDAPADRAQNAATYSDPSLPLDPTLVPLIAEFLHAALPASGK